MADNNEEAKAPESAPTSEAPAASLSEEDKDAALTTAPEDGTLNPDQSFAYWLVMLPFLAIAGICLYNFYQNPGSYTQLFNALGSIVVGVFAASFVNALTGDKSGNADEASTEAPPTNSST
ncbi:MAG: hypothetical protein K2X77_12725 [Candidatus Obscuribacterales bacterium]|nr:hypothetical protein [Candidatus Obscuribacterales bacterium]